MVIDCFTLNGENELFDLHYNILCEYVDEVRVISFDKTFSGQKKQKIFPELDWSLYPKAKFYLHTEHQYGKYLEMAYLSPQTQGADHWKLEFAQKESIKDILSDLDDEDSVYIGDVDEIWKPRVCHFYRPVKLELLVYTYYLNNRSNERFAGTLAALWGAIKDKSLNHLRGGGAPWCEGPHGWHFTSMGGPEALKKKLTDSYTEESYATQDVLSQINSRYGEKDFLGRGFMYTIDESQWPRYLIENRDKYQHLLATR